MWRYTYRNTGSYGWYFFLGMTLGGALVFALPVILPFLKNWAFYFLCGSTPVAGILLVRTIQEEQRRARERREQMWDDCWDSRDMAFDISGRRGRGRRRSVLHTAVSTLLRRRCKA